MSLNEKQFKFARMVSMLISRAFEMGFEVALGEGERTAEQQAIYVSRGKSKVTHSKHQDRLAVDLHLFKDDQYLGQLEDNEAILIIRPLGEYWESLDPENKWGGDWGWDLEHFQYGE